MTDVRDPDLIISAWLDEGPTALPEPNRRSITTATRTITQRRRGLALPWRFLLMNGYSRLVLAAAAVVVAAIGSFYLLSPSSPPSSMGGPGPTPTASPIPSPTAVPSPTLRRAAVGTVTLNASGCAFEPGPDPLAAGPSQFRAVNETEYRAGFDLWRMREGRAFDELVVHIENEQRRIAAGQPVIGYPFHLAAGPANLEQDAGESGWLLDEISPGTHAFVCYRDVDEAGQGAIYLTEPFEVR